MEQEAQIEHSASDTAPVYAGGKSEADTAVCEAAEEPIQYESSWLDDGAILIRATRLWIQYGLVGFTILCILVGAVEALFGR